MTTNTLFEQIIRNNSKTFYLTSFFAPKEIKKRVFTLYAFVRTADDFVDASPPRVEEYEAYKKATIKAFRGEKTGNILIDSFYHLAKEKRFEKEWILSFFTSQDFDIQKRTYQTFAELETYIYGVAEIIGLCMAQIMDLPKEAYPASRLLGKAMQLLNIVRDIEEDYKLGRVYIPQEEIKQFGLTSIVPKNREQIECFNNLIRYQLDRFDSILRQAQKGTSYLPKQLLFPGQSCADLYKKVAQKIYKKPYIVFEKKVKPSYFEIGKTIVINYFRTIT